MFLYYAFESTWIPRILPFEAAIARMQFGVVNKATAKECRKRFPETQGETINHTKSQEGKGKLWVQIDRHLKKFERPSRPKNW